MHKSNIARKRSSWRNRWQVEINGVVVEDIRNHQQWSDYKALVVLRDKYLTGSVHEFEYRIYKIVPAIFPEAIPAFTRPAAEYSNRQW